MAKVVRVRELTDGCGGVTTVQMENGESFTVRTSKIRRLSLVQGSRLKLKESTPYVFVNFGGEHLATL